MDKDQEKKEKARKKYEGKCHPKGSKEEHRRLQYHDPREARRSTEGFSCILREARRGTEDCMMKIADYITKVTAMMQQQEAKIQLSCAGVDNPWTTAQEGFY